VNYLAKLVARAASPQRAIAPRLPSRFEATPIDGAPLPEVFTGGGVSEPLHPSGVLETAPHVQTTTERIVEVARVIHQQVQQTEPLLAPPLGIERVESQREIHTREIERSPAALPTEREIRTERTTEKEVVRTRGESHGETLPEVRAVREVPGERIIEKQLAPPSPEPRVVTERIMQVAPPPVRAERTFTPRRTDVSPAHQPQQPTIQVTIGRVDVRAVMPAASQPRAERAPKAPELSLADYLAQRKGGSR